MLDEIRAGVEHISSLLVATPSPKVVDDFCAVLCARLELRYAKNWFPRDGERGSASRALAWHAHGGGEGLDCDILAAARRTLLDAHDNSSIAFQPSKATATAAAAALFTTPFTLWIDPGCVAVRHGFGPGTYIEGAPAQPQNFDVLFGSAPTAKPSMPVTASTVMPPPPTLALLPSTPAIGSDSTAHGSPAVVGPKTVQHYRAPSWASSTASHYRSESPTSRSSSLTTASSSACPSLVAASSTHCDSDSEYCDGEEDGEDDCSQLSIQDMMDRGGFKNFDIIDDDDEVDAALQRRMECMDADVTVGETTFGLFGTTGDQTVQADENNDDDKSASIAITSYDGGNVGVLGGGVRLGASRAAAAPIVKAKQPWHPSQAWDNGTPTTLPLPPAQAWSYISASPLSATGHFPHALPSPTAVSPCLSSVSGDMQEQQYVMIDGYAVPIAKRGRTRGRRSRGRGAGRAARRQAAAAAAAAQDGQDMDRSWSDDGDLTAPTIVMPSALGISMNSGVKSTQSMDADARLMAIVRQRADQVAKDVVRRHLMDQQQQQQQRGKSIDHSRNSTPRMPSYAAASPALRGKSSTTFTQLPPMPAAAVAHQQYFQQQQQPHYNMIRPSYLPAHVQQPVSFSPRINAMHGGMY